MGAKTEQEITLKRLKQMENGLRAMQANVGAMLNEVEALQKTFGGAVWIDVPTTEKPTVQPGDPPPKPGTQQRVV